MADEDTPTTVKLQANLDGYEAWAFAQLMEKKGRKNHDLCRSIVREWFRFKSEELRRDFGVSREEWERQKGGNVRLIAKGRKRPPGGG